MEVKDKIKLIYLMGAGRSGTTALAIILGSHKDILCLGELHQFHEHILNGKSCTCSKVLSECEVWSPVIKQLNYPQNLISEIDKENNKVQKHKNILPLILDVANKSLTNKFIDNQLELFNAIKKANPIKGYYLDSAKYIARALALRKSDEIDIRIIYLNRDPRGVIWSFKKQVQTSRSAIRTVGYYWIINLFGHLVYLLLPKKNILKINYEELSDNPNQSFNKIGKFIGLDLSEISDRIDKELPFKMPHIVGGNRLKKNKSLLFKRDFVWREKSGAFFRYFYYILTLPFMIINKYKA